MAANNKTSITPCTPSAPSTPSTLRLQLQLFPSTEKNCPEFNYRDLLNHHTPKKNKQDDKSKKKNGTSNGLNDPFSDNDDDVERIAKQFEQKYGSSSTYGKKKKRSKIDDYADIGAGYDENDSFIDNTDGYDEMMPPECDTAYGGFYINSGSLEFKSVNVKNNDTTVASADGEDSSPNAPRKSHKRALSTSESDDESSSSNSVASTTEKPTDTEAENAKANGVTDSDKSGDDARKVKSSSKRTDENIPKKRRKSSQDISPIDETPIHVKTVKELLAEARTCVSSNRRRDPSTDSGSSDSESKPMPAVQSSDNQASSDSSREIPPPAPPPQQPAPSPTFIPSPAQPTPPPAPPLPPGLPPEATVLARRLKALADAHFSSHTGKLSGQEVNEIILGMEKQCRRPGVTPSLRQALFGHAAALLRRGKPGLIQRARRLADEQSKMEQNSTPLDKLKGIIEKMKPGLLENYRKESQKIIETNKAINVQNAVLEDDKKLPERRLPKRRFPWNDQVRAVLLEILETQGDNVVNNDETMAKYLMAAVFPLFPSGFVRMPTLIQQSKLSMTKKVPDANNKQRTTPKPLETKILNPQVLMNKTSVKLPQNSIDDKPEKLTFEAKLPSGTICTKAEDSKPLQVDKPKVHNAGNPQVLGDNLCISITNVISLKKTSTEKSHSPPKMDRVPVPTNIGSLTITPVNNSPKDSQSKTSPSFSGTSPAPDLQSSPNNNHGQVSPGTIKVKSVNALFDKETIAKIISSKNNDSNNKHGTSNRDPQRVKSSDMHKSHAQIPKIHSDYGVKNDNHQSSRVSMNSDSKVSSSDISKPHLNSNDLFVKPKSIKNDHSPYTGRIHNNSEHQDVIMKDSESYKSDSIRLNKKYPESPSSTTYLKSPTAPATNNSHATDISKTVNQPNSARSLNFATHHHNRSRPREASDSYDSSSDDCVEIISEDNRASKAHDDGAVPENIQKQFEMQYRAIYAGSQVPDKRSSTPKSSDFSIKNIVKESDHSVKHILHTSHQDKHSDIPVTSKTSETKCDSNASRVGRSDEDNHFRNVPDRNSFGEERSHPISVIKDNFTNKSDRSKELVPDTETARNNTSPMNVTIEQDMDFTRMMQGYKELEDFQMKSPDDLSQRLYDDAANKIRKSSILGHSRYNPQ